MQERGFTLIELLIGVAIGAVVMSGVMISFLAFNRSNLDNIRTARLDHELRTIMRLINTDLRRAGYWANASDMVATGANTNPFMQAGTTDIQINVGGDCILFTYDLDKDGAIAALNTAAGDEHFGYRLSGTSLQARPIALATHDCADAAASWENLTDPDVVEVMAFTITPNPMVIDLDGTGAATATLTIRNYTVSVTGRLTNDPTVTRTLTSDVRVRNDLYTP